MKLRLLLIPILFLSSCTIDWNDEKDKKITELEKQVNNLQIKINNSEEKLALGFESKDLWVSFRTFYATPGIYAVDMNKIQFLGKYWDYYSHISQSMQVLYRTTLQSPMDRIGELIIETWINPDNCEVNLAYTDDYWFDHHIIELKNKTVAYSGDEKKKLDFAKSDSEESGWPAFEFTKVEIYNDQLLKVCGKYAVWKAPATSTTYWSYFISSSWSTTMLYHPSWADPSIIENGTLKLFDPISTINP